jgi:prephenate dehydrogenase
LELGALDEAYADPAVAVRDADLVVLCTPVGMLGELLAQVAPSLKPGAVVTDVGSTKRDIVAAAAKGLKGRENEVFFIGSHPMAGSDKRGVRFAQADLYKDALCILTPDGNSEIHALQYVESFWKRLGMRTTRLSPEEHDRLVSDISHLPHAVAAALMTVQSPESLSLRGRGFLDATRIAAGDAGLWRDIFLSNKDNLAASIGRLQGQLNELQALLKAGDSEGVTRWLEKAAAMRQRF